MLRYDIHFGTVNYNLTHQVTTSLLFGSHDTAPGHDVAFSADIQASQSSKFRRLSRIIYKFHETSGSKGARVLTDSLGPRVPITVFLSLRMQ